MSTHPPLVACVGGPACGPMHEPLPPSCAPTVPLAALALTRVEPGAPPIALPCVMLPPECCEQKREVVGRGCFDVTHPCRYLVTNPARSPVPARRRTSSTSPPAPRRPRRAASRATAWWEAVVFVAVGLRALFSVLLIFCAEKAKRVGE